MLAYVVDVCRPWRDRGPRSRVEDLDRQSCNGPCGSSAYAGPGGSRQEGFGVYEEIVTIRNHRGSVHAKLNDDLLESGDVVLTVTRLDHTRSAVKAVCPGGAPRGLGARPTVVAYAITIVVAGVVANDRHRGHRRTTRRGCATNAPASYRVADSSHDRTAVTHETTLLLISSDGANAHASGPPAPRSP